MPYCAISDIRAISGYESVTTYPDADITAAIALASNWIDNYTNQWFEPREYTFEVEGCDHRDLRLPVPPIEITSVTENDLDVDSDSYEIKLQDSHDSRMNPRLRMLNGTWGGEIVIEGTFGYVLDPGGANTTPPEIKKACIIKTLEELKAPSEEDNSSNALVSETIGNYTYQKGTGGNADVPRIYRLLIPFKRIRAIAV